MNPCPYCHGTGDDPDRQADSCPACGGECVLSAEAVAEMGQWFDATREALIAEETCRE